MIPSQDKLVSYLENTSQLPNEESIVEPISSPFRTNFMTSREARKQTRKNIDELSRITGQTFLNVI